MSSRPPESAYDSKLIQQNVASNADRRQFWFRPWIKSSGLSPEQLAASVRSSLESTGTWTDVCELSMGGGPTVRIDLVERNGEVVYRATGGVWLKISAEYRTLEDALDMVHLFARLSDDVVTATRDHHLVFG